jgi:hypothetical protein
MLLMRFRACVLQDWGVVVGNPGRVIRVDEPDVER